MADSPADHKVDGVVNDVMIDNGTTADSPIDHHVEEAVTAAVSPNNHNTEETVTMAVTSTDHNAEETVQDVTANTGAIINNVAPQASNHLKFTCFPKLPTELRTMIWKLSLPGQRFIELRSTLMFNHYIDRSGKGILEYRQDYSTETFHAVARQHYPSIYLLNYETKQLVEKTYMPIKSTDGFPTILWNPDVDILCVRYSNFYPYVDASYEVFRHATKMLVNDEIIAECECTFDDSLLLMDNLKELMVTVSLEHFDVDGIEIPESVGTDDEDGIGNFIAGFIRLDEDQLRQKGRGSVVCTSSIDELKIKFPEWAAPNTMVGLLETDRNSSIDPISRFMDDWDPDFTVDEEMIADVLIR